MASVGAAWGCPALGPWGPWGPCGPGLPALPPALFFPPAPFLPAPFPPGALPVWPVPGTAGAGSPGCASYTAEPHMIGEPPRLGTILGSSLTLGRITLDGAALFISLAGKVTAAVPS